MTSNVVPGPAARVVAVVVPAVAVVLSVWHPHGFAATPAAGAVVTLAGLAAGAIIEAVHAFGRYGLSWAAAREVWTDEEQWLHDNAAAVKQAFEQARPALDALPGAAAGLDAVTGRVSALESTVAAIPVSQLQALTSALTPPAAPTPATAPPSVSG